MRLDRVKIENLKIQFEWRPCLDHIEEGKHRISRSTNNYGWEGYCSCSGDGDGGLR